MLSASRPCYSLLFSTFSPHLHSQEIQKKPQPQRERPKPTRSTERNHVTNSLMAVEAPHNHTNLFPPQFLINTHRGMIKPNHHHHQMDGAAMTVASTMPESLLPLYASNVCDPNSMNKADSGLTYNIPVPRKRSRDSIAESNALPLPQKNKLSSHSQSTFLYHLHNHQSEIDHLISQHTERVRMELEEHRMRQSRMLLIAIQEAVVKKLKEKDEEIQRMGKLSWALQERVKTLCLENQVWRELAQTNEATANSLRTNLEQVLAHVSNDDHHQYNNGHDDDAESSCGSNHREEAADVSGGGGDSASAARMCKKCGERESIVLLLPCRHLCLCTMCGSIVRNCPLCHSGINASVHVNLS